MAVRQAGSFQARDRTLLRLNPNGRGSEE